MLDKVNKISNIHNFSLKLAISNFEYSKNIKENVSEEFNQFLIL